MTNAGLALSGTQSLFADLVGAEYEAHHTGIRTRPLFGPRRAAAQAVERAGVDAFFREQCSAMRRQEHWAEQVLFSDVGLAILRFVAVPRQAPATVSNANISVLSVETEPAGTIVAYYGDHAVPFDLAPTRRFAVGEFDRAALVDVYSEFVTWAVRKSLLNVRREG